MCRDLFLRFPEGIYNLLRLSMPACTPLSAWSDIGAEVSVCGKLFSSHQTKSIINNYYRLWSLRPLPCQKQAILASRYRDHALCIHYLCWLCVVWCVWSQWKNPWQRRMSGLANGLVNIYIRVASDHHQSNPAQCQRLIWRYFLRTLDLRAFTVSFAQIMFFAALLRSLLERMDCCCNQITVGRGHGVFEFATLERDYGIFSCWFCGWRRSPKR